MSDTNTTEVDEKRELVVGVTGVHGESSKETTIAGKLQVSPEHPFAEALVSGVHLSQDVDVASKGDGQQTSPTALQQVQTLAKLLTLLALPKAGSRTSKASSKSAASQFLALSARFSAFNRTTSGLDRSLMLLNYALKIVVGFGGAIAIRRRLAGGAKVALATTTTRLEEFVRRSDVFQAALGDARTMMRILGIFGAVSALPSVIASGSRLRLAQVLALVAYYPLEAGAYLTAKGVLPISAATAGRWSLWSVRFWALWVGLEAVALSNRWRGLVKQAQSVSAADTEAKTVELDAQVEGWAEEALVNAAYAPLTIHWSTPGGLWLNPAWTGVFGVVAAATGIRAGWRRMAS